MAYKGPSGLTGTPENLQAFVHLRDEEIDIYLAQDIWDGSQPYSEKLLFAVEGYGRFWLWLDDRDVKSN